MGAQEVLKDGENMLKITKFVLLSAFIVQTSYVQASSFFPKSFQKIDILVLENYFNKASNGSIYLNNDSKEVFYIDKDKNYMLVSI